MHLNNEFLAIERNKCPCCGRFDTVKYVVCGLCGVAIKYRPWLNGKEYSELAIVRRGSTFQHIVGYLCKPCAEHLPWELRVRLRRKKITPDEVIAEIGLPECRRI